MVASLTWSRWHHDRVQVGLTLAEASQVLDPPMTEQQLRHIIRALHWQPAGWRHPGGRGHATATYDAGDLMRLHQALVPFLRSAVL